MALSFRLEDYLWRLMNAVVNGLGRIINELGSSWCRVVLQVDKLSMSRTGYRISLPI